MNDVFRSILTRPGTSRRFAHSVCLGLLLAAPAARAENVLTFARSPDCYVSTTGRITTTAFTVEMWFRQTGFDSENQLLHQDVPGDNGRLILTTIYGTNRFHIGNNMLYAKTRIASNTWTHVAYVRNASGTGYIYLNGALDTSAAMNTYAIATNTIVIGRLFRASAGFRGQISDVRVWNVARAQADIKNSMSNRLTGAESGLIAYWRLDEGFGASAFNRASPAHGAITGATWSDLPDCPVIPLEPRGAWSAAGGGSWSGAANWLNNAIPSGSGAQAFFTNNPPSGIAVANDLPALTLGQLTVSGASSHTFTGNSLALTNAYWAGRIVAASGAHTVGLPVALSTLGLSAEPQAAAALELAGVVSGPGGVTANAGASGGGTVTLSGANTYTGPTALTCGTLAVNSLANGGVASAIGASSASATNLLLGPGTLRYNGPSAVTDRGYTLQAGGNPIRAAVFDTDSDITFAGPVTALSGAFIKTGSGTVRYTYPGAQTLAVHESGIDALMNLGANGDSPTTGFSGLTVSEGKVILGAPGQTNTVNCRITIGHYTTTNANAETAGELEINDGVLNCNTTVSIGRCNGNTVTVPAGAASRLTINGGTFNMNLLSMGVQNAAFSNFNARPSCDINGGALNVAAYCHIGETTGSVATINARGGTFRVSGANGANGIILGGPSSASAGIGILNLSGSALVDVAYSISLANIANGKGYVNLDGGTLVARTLAKGAGSEAVLRLNGGTFMSRAEGYTLSGLTAAYVSTNGALFDTSLASYTIAQNLLHDPALAAAPDGGLVKLGTNTLTLAGYGSTYTGPTIVSNGTLAIAAALPAGNALAAASGGEALIGGSATQTVAAAEVTLSGSGALGFAFTADGAANDRLSVASTPSLGSGRIALYLQNTRLPFTRNGTYTLLTYAGADPAVSGLTCANPAYGKAYTFAAAGGSLTVTIGSDAAASVWNVNASGAWAAGANWTVAPSKAAGDQVRFDSAITGPVTVTTAGETAGEIFFNNLSSYTLGGSGLTIDNDTAPAVINVESGSHTIAAPLVLIDDTVITLPASTRLTLGASSGASSALTAQGNGTLALTAAPALKSLTLNLPDLAFSNTLTVAVPVALQRSVTVTPAQSTTVTVSSVVSGSGGLTKAGSNTLALTAANTYAGPTTVSGGTLTANALANGGSASSIGASTAAAGNLVLGPATFRYTGPAVTVNRGYTLASGSGKTAVLRAEGDLTFAGQVLTTSGSILKAGPGTLSYTYAGAQTLALAEGNADSLLNIGPNGDSPTAGFSGLTISEGKVVLGVPGQTNTINNRITVGHYTTTAAGAETAGELVINGGVLNCNTTVSIARGNGTTTTAGTTGLTSRITVNGGIVNFGLLALGFKGGTPSGYNARPACDINGGTVTLSSQVYVGESQGSTATLNVRGGLLRINGQASNSGLHVGGYQNPSGTGILNLSGSGVVEVVYGVTLGTFSGGVGTVNLDGGTLIASNIVKGAGSSAVLRFNGGTFCPRSAGQTLSGLTAAYVSTNSACIDTSLGSLTFAQNLLSDPALGGAADGGLVKLGTNTLSLTGTGNTYKGLIDVRAGTLAARIGATNSLLVATNACFDALGQRAIVGDLRGGGILTNGVIAVSGTLDAGTNGAPAGARMAAQNLSLLAGSTFACTWTTNALGQVTNDFVAVSGTLAPEGAGFVDFGRTEANPIPMPFSATVMSYGTFSGSFAGWKAVNTGLPPAVHPALVITAADGRVTVQVRYSGLLLMVK